MPLFSIVIPVYNMGFWLPTALESCLWQTHKNIEVIIINDGSTDDTQTIADFYVKNTQCITCHTQPNKGIGESRKKGQDLAQGDFILWLDADDFLAPTAAEKMLRLAIQDNVPFVCGNAVSFSDKTYHTHTYVPHHEAHNLTFLTSPNYWKSKALWRWIFSLPFLKKGKNGLPFIHPNFNFGLSSTCFMFDVLTSGGTFSQCIDEIYYFRREHKEMTPSPKLLVDQKLTHYLEIKNILLKANTIKPFIKYLNEEYWHDLQLTMPHMVTQNIQWLNQILEISFEVFSGLSIDWFTEKFLRPELKEHSKFIHFAKAFINKDKATAIELLLSLTTIKQPLFSEGTGLLKTLQSEINLLFYNRSRKTKAYLKKLDTLVGIRTQDMLPKH